MSLRLSAACQIVEREKTRIERLSLSAVLYVNTYIDIYSIPCPSVHALMLQIIVGGGERGMDDITATKWGKKERSGTKPPPVCPSSAHLTHWISGGRGSAVGAHVRPGLSRLVH